jgi:hypothetical protein
MLWLDGMKQVYGLRGQKWRSMWEDDGARPEDEDSRAAVQDSTREKATEIIMRAVDEIMSVMVLKLGLPSDGYKKAGTRLEMVGAVAKKELRCKYH